MPSELMRWLDHHNVIGLACLELEALSEILIVKCSSTHILLWQEEKALCKSREWNPSEIFEHNGYHPYQCIDLLKV